MTRPRNPELPDDGQRPPAVIVKPLDDGPLRIEGPLRVVDQVDTAYDIHGQHILFLCRCGGSATKPFCDGTHAALGFAADERAPVEEN